MTEHPSGRQQSTRVLVVEDDDITAGEILAALHDHGFSAQRTATGHEGLLHALSGTFHIIVLDRMLPGIDGLSILTTMRNVGVDTPVLVLSALNAVNERVRGLHAGCDDYLTKPFSFLELTARLDALLRRGVDTPEPGALRVGDLELDSVRHTATRGCVTVELKPREFKLLEYLMRHADQVVTRTLLFEAVWNYPADAQTNVIDVHMSQLRRKIMLDGQRPSMIHTVRGSGYVLRASD
ncbi:response regulator transcription factor [Burkholderia sp. L27(2015)]|uniref:response regulator transcription factor n=1 Tax=Burkholderia sp. L27(2015) TaxID=1641858 RepID=UPI00131AB9EE|nr:response regulator transcription factor [Burkholderia sp. L27(2015)]